MTRGGALAFSCLAHVAAIGAASVSWLLVVEPVAAPPIPIRFVSAPPIAPVLRPPAAPDTPPETSPDETLPPPTPSPEPPAPPEREAEPPAAEVTTAGASASAGSPVPANVPSTAPLSVAGKDTFEPPGSLPRYVAGGRAHVVTVGAVDSYSSGTAAADAAAPGQDILKQVAAGRAAGAGGPGGGSGAMQSLPGRLSPLQPSGERSAAATRPAVPAATAAGSPDSTGPVDEDAAQKFGHRYSVQLVDARGLGHSTHDGWRYSQLLPLLSEAYRRVAPLGSAATSGRGPDDDVESVRIDADAIAIAYRDGTRHVVAPTRDGLVALYVAAGPVERSKVEEIERALGALRRLLHAEVRS